MLQRYRRYFAVLAFLLLGTPLVVGIVAPDAPASILKEGRRPESAPAAPDNWAALPALPGKVDAYLKDRLGLREKMIRVHKDLTKPLLFQGDSVVIIGRDGRLFSQGDDMVRQSAGRVVRDRGVSDVADMVAAMRDALRRRGTKFLVAVAPNSSTIYQDDLPIWAQNGGKQTEYDLLLEDLVTRRVEAVDLRPALQAARTQGVVYRMNDLHWTMRGAIAGFNAIAEADGHANWRLDPASALGPPITLKGGDIAGIVGDGNVTEKSEQLILPTAEKEFLSPGKTLDYIEESGASGPTIMVIGDSFTMDFFPPMLLPHVARFIWLHHQYCGFDWRWIDKLRPDEVWWVPVERFLVCRPGKRPVNFGNEERAAIER